MSNLQQHIGNKTVGTGTTPGAYQFDRLIKALPVTNLNTARKSDELISELLANVNEYAPETVTALLAYEAAQYIKSLEEEIAKLNRKSIHGLEITAAQLQEVLDFVFADADARDDHESSARIAFLPAEYAPIGDNNIRMKPGLYACDAEYPEEGWIPLFDDADNDDGGAA
ncbi:hypothetical protein [Undibacterium crateris]|uniref:hypothetical protein n=1 Tax=Undibacterium crateris TaxID=2528175 RepID=UPI0013897F9C|nr:hypothetical protein [Undibacterium crateris]NDI85039.1 hypothetical protein [Undibacterium crateris]